MMAVYAVGGRYIQNTYGLFIQNITAADDGIYYCRAEVDAEGRYNERAIEVIVYSKFEYASALSCSCIFMFFMSCAIIIIIVVLDFLIRSAVEMHRLILCNFSINQTAS